jgi:hypothetical protein
MFLYPVQRVRRIEFMALSTQVIHDAGLLAFARIAVAVARVSAATLYGEALNLKAYLAVFRVERNRGVLLNLRHKIMCPVHIEAEAYLNVRKQLLLRHLAQVVAETAIRLHHMESMFHDLRVAHGVDKMNV